MGRAGAVACMRNSGSFLEWKWWLRRIVGGVRSCMYRYAVQLLRLKEGSAQLEVLCRTELKILRSGMA
jgi:hypothetical protein